MSLTLWVDWLGGGAFLLKSASEIASHGSTSSFRTVKRGLSHRFLESGASNLNTSASKLQKTSQMIVTYKTTTDQNKKKNQKQVPHSHVLSVPLSSISAAVPRWAHFIWRQTVRLHKEAQHFDLCYYCLGKSHLYLWKKKGLSNFCSHQTVWRLRMFDETEQFIPVACKK